MLAVLYYALCLVICHLHTVYDPLVDFVQVSILKKKITDSKALINCHILSSISIAQINKTPVKIFDKQGVIIPNVNTFAYYLI